MLELRFLPKLLLQHDASPVEVLEDVQSAFLQAVRQHVVQSSVSPSGDGLAVALGQRLVVLNLFNHGSPLRHSGNSNNGNAAVEFVSAVDAPETVTALAWMSAGAQSADECILAGTSAGFLQLHSAVSGTLLLRQQLHHSAVVAANVRWSGCGSDPADLSEDVTLAFADAAVRLPAWEVWAAVRWHAGRSGGSWWGGGGTAGAAAHQLSFSKFSLPKGAGPRSHAICLGPPLPSLYEALSSRQEQQCRLHILTAGSSPPLAAYEAEESAAPGLLSLVSDLASSTAASLLGRARAYVPGPAAAAGRSLLGGLRRHGGGSAGSGSEDGGGSAGEAQQQQQGAKQKKEKIPGEPSKLAAAVWDEKRSITHLALSPTGRWAACCDSLGRVLLVDTTATLVVRMLKGYRDAQVAWLVCSTENSGGGSSSRRRGGLAGSRGSGLAPLGGSDSSLGSLGSSLPGGLNGSTADLASLPYRQQQQQESPVKELNIHPPAPAAGGSLVAEPIQVIASPQRQQQEQEQALPRGDAAVSAAQQRVPGGHLLVIYAPRRGVVELWEPQSLTRLGSVHCAAQLGLLLQQPTRRCPGSGAGVSYGSTAFQPNSCLLLDAAALTLIDLTSPLTDLL